MSDKQSYTTIRVKIQSKNIFNSLKALYSQKNNVLISDAKFFGGIITAYMEYDPDKLNGYNPLME